MKKRIFVLMMGLAVCASALTGCNRKAGENTEISEVQEDTEPETAEPETAEPETWYEEDGMLDDDSAAEDLSVPVRIWGTILSVSDTELFVDNQSGASSAGEISLNIDWTQNRVIDAQTGFPVQESEVELGSFEAYLGPVMTLSLPPQTTPVLVIVNIPEDSQAPQYAVTEDMTEEEDGTLLLTATDGRTYRLSGDTEVSPFLTKNMVTLDDIEAGTECLIWLNGEDMVEKAVLFGK